MKSPRMTATAVLLLCLCWVAAARADTLELLNGDTLSGKVVSVSEDQVILQSDVLGRLTITRAKVAAIHLGDRPPVRRQPAPADADSEVVPGAPAAGEAKRGKPGEVRPTEQQLVKALWDRGLKITSLADLKKQLPEIKLPEDNKPEQTPEDVIRKLRTEGIDPKTLDEVVKQVPLLAVPGVRGYFNKTLNGLVSGEMDLQDLRRDAMKAREGLLDIQKDLGENGAALNGYLMILDGFLEQTDPKRPDAPPAPGNPPAPQASKRSSGR